MTRRNKDRAGAVQSDRKQHNNTTTQETTTQETTRSINTAEQHDNNSVSAHAERQHESLCSNERCIYELVKRNVNLRPDQFK